MNEIRYLKLNTIALVLMNILVLMLLIRQERYINKFSSEIARIDRYLNVISLIEGK